MGFLIVDELNIFCSYLILDINYTTILSYKIIIIKKSNKGITSFKSKFQPQVGREKKKNVENLFSSVPEFYRF